MKLTEILNKKVDYEVVRATNSVFHTRATIGDRVINFGAIDEEDYWELSFGEKTKDGKVTYKQTNSGNELEVFSMVKDSILEFITRYNPAVMELTADKSEGQEVNTRANLYGRLINKFKLPGYTVNRESKNGTDVFRIVKD